MAGGSLLASISARGVHRLGRIVAPTPQTVAEMAKYVRVFRDRGGIVRFPPHRPEERRLWVATAKSNREAWDYLPVMQRTDRLRRGLSYMWAALRYPRCIVAFLGREAVAALSYDVKLDRVEVRVVGSRQADNARGAGTALELGLAEEGIRRRLPVRGDYEADSRNFHLRLGRRLDLVAHENSSEWTLEDCQFIVGGIEKAL